MHMKLPKMPEAEYVVKQLSHNKNSLISKLTTIQTEINWNSWVNHINELQD